MLSHLITTNVTFCRGGLQTTPMAKPDSDLDFLVELESNRSLLERVGLTQYLEELLGTKVDVATDKGLRESIRDRILQEALPL